MECHTWKGGVTVCLVNPPLWPRQGYDFEVTSEASLYEWQSSLKDLFKKKRRSKTTKLHSLDQTADRSCYCHVGSSQNLKPNQMWSTWLSCSFVSSLHSISRVLSLSASSSTVIWLVFLWLGWRCSGSRLAFLLWLIEVAPLCVSVPQGDKMSSVRGSNQWFIILSSLLLALMWHKQLAFFYFEAHL